MTPKLVRVDLADLDRAFRKVGMEMTGTKDIMVRFIHKGVLVAKTKFSSGRGGVKTWVLQAIKKQLLLDAQKFNDLVNCPLDRNGLIKHYRQIGQISGTE